MTGPASAWPLRRWIAAALWVCCMAAGGGSASRAQGPLHAYGPYRAVAVTGRGTAFVASRRQLQEIDLSTGELVRHWPGGVTALSMAEDGALWGLGVEGRVFVLDQGDVEPRYPAEFVTGYPSGARLTALSSRETWVLRPGNGADLLRLGEGDAIVHYELAPPPVRGGTPPLLDTQGRLFWLAPCQNERHFRFGGNRPLECTLNVFDSRSEREESLLDGVEDLALYPDGSVAALMANGSVIDPDRTRENLVPPQLVITTDLYLAIDGAGSPWIVGGESGEVWERDAGAWIERNPLPGEIGRVAGVAGDPEGGGLIVLGAGGLARWAPGGGSRILLTASPDQRLPPFAWLVALAMIVGLFSLLMIGVLLFQAHRSHPGRKWSALDGFMGVAVFLAGQVCCQLLLVAVLAIKLEDPRGLLVSFFAGAVAAVVWIRWRLTARGDRWEEIGLTRKIAAEELVWGALATVPGWLLVVGVALTAENLGLPSFLYEQLGAAKVFDVDRPFDVVLVALIGVVLAPLFEEIVFRGFLLTCLRQRWGTGLALVVSSLVFGMVHGEGILTVGTLGLVFGALALWRGSLTASITAHALVNGVSLALMIGLR